MPLIFCFKRTIRQPCKSSAKGLVIKIVDRVEQHPILKDDLNSKNPFAVEIRRTGIELKLNELLHKIKNPDSIVITKQ